MDETQLSSCFLFDGSSSSLLPQERKKGHFPAKRCLQWMEIESLCALNTFINRSELMKCAGVAVVAAGVLYRRGTSSMDSCSAPCTITMPQTCPSGLCSWKTALLSVSRDRWGGVSVTWSETCCYQPRPVRCWSGFIQDGDLVISS